MPQPEFTIRVQPLNRDMRIGTHKTLLAAALAAGLEPANSCRMGYCGACRARLISGAIEYPSGRRVEASQGPAAEEIMLCIARARSDIEVELVFPTRSP